MAAKKGKKGQQSANVQKSVANKTKKEKNVFKVSNPKKQQKATKQVPVQLKKVIFFFLLFFIFNYFIF